MGGYWHNQRSAYPDGIQMLTGRKCPTLGDLLDHPMTGLDCKYDPQNLCQGLLRPDPLASLAAL